MKTYYTKPKSFRKSELSTKSFNANSLCPKDYRIFFQKNKNTKLLYELINSKDVGNEIGSDSYMKYSKYRFLKTVNLTSGFILNEDSVEYCKPENTVFPKKGDILIAKDGGGEGLGEACIYNKDNFNNGDSISSGIIRITPKKEYLYYILGFLKGTHFKTFVDLNTAQGSTIRHSKLISLDYPIPFPTENNNQNPDKIESLVSLIVQNIIDKEQQIRLKNEDINKSIELELKNNQKVSDYKYKYPKISEIKKVGRLDTGMYEKKFKRLETLFKNYSKSQSYELEKDLKYDISRGQNLQISNIGRSYYSDTIKRGFYKLLISKYFNKLGCFTGCQYLGSKEKLKTIKSGDIIFSCRGNLGRVIIFNESFDNTITNIDNVHIRKEGVEWYETTFIGLWLKYLENCGYFSKIAITGSGADSFTKYQFKELPILVFPELKQKEIAIQYYNKQSKNVGLNFDNYLELEKERNKKLGIFQLNMELFALREKLEDIIDKIIMEEPIEINFDY